MKTKEEIIDAVLVDGNLIFSSRAQKEGIMEAMEEYADQEKQALKERIITDIKKQYESSIYGLICTRVIESIEAL